MYEQPEKMTPHRAASPDETFRLPGELQSFEAALAQLRPGAATIDRDRLLFLAGQASAASTKPVGRPLTPTWFWPASSAVMTCVAMVLFVLLIRQRPPTTLDGQAIAAGSSPAKPATATASPREQFRAPVEPLPGAWTMAERWRLSDDLLNLDSFAHASADLPARAVSSGVDDILSSRSFKQVLDDTEHQRRASERILSPKSSG